MLEKELAGKARRDKEKQNKRSRRRVFTLEKAQVVAEWKESEVWEDEYEKRVSGMVPERRQARL